MYKRIVEVFSFSLFRSFFICSFLCVLLLSTVNTAHAAVTVLPSVNTPLELVLEVSDVTTTGPEVLTVFILESDVDAELFEVPVRIDVGSSEVSSVVSSVSLDIEGVVYDFYTVTQEGTSAFFTFYVGHEYGEPRMVLQSGVSVEVSVTVSFKAQSGNYENHETLQVYVSEAESGSVVAKRIATDQTPALLAEQLITDGLIELSHEDEARALSLTFPLDASVEYIESCINLGIILPDNATTARGYAYEVDLELVEGSGFGNTHELVVPALFIERTSLDAISETFGVDDDVLGIFTFEFEATASVYTYFLSATNTEIFDIQIEENGTEVSELVSVVFTTSAVRVGDVYRFDPDVPELCTLVVTIHPNREGDFLASLHSLQYGTSLLSLNDKTVLMVPEEDFITDSVTLYADSVPDDITSPVLTIIGDNPLTLVAGSTFTDPWVYAEDDVDGDISESVEVVGEVDMSVAGEYVLEYFVSDEAGNETSITRTVVVRNQTTSGGGGGSSRDTSPPRNIRIEISGNKGTTTVRDVLLVLSAQDASRPIEMQVSDREDFTSAVWVPFTKNMTFTVSGTEGRKYIFARFADARGNISETVSDSIWYSPEIGTDVLKPKGRVQGESVYFFYNDIELGMQSTDVLELQKRLMTEGVYTHSSATGYFGPITLAAVKQFQSRYGVDPTGYVGPLTRGVLNTGYVSEDVLSLEELVQLLLAVGVIAPEKTEAALTVLQTL
jgi:Domain of unknown function (DUF5011)/Putative peptidoglycan binding domain